MLAEKHIIAMSPELGTFSKLSFTFNPSTESLMDIVEQNAVWIEYVFDYFRLKEVDFEDVPWVPYGFPESKDDNNEDEVQVEQSDLIPIVDE